MSLEANSKLSTQAGTAQRANFLDKCIEKKLDV